MHTKPHPSIMLPVSVAGRGTILTNSTPSRESSPGLSGDSSLECFPMASPSHSSASSLTSEMVPMFSNVGIALAPAITAREAIEALTLDDFNIIMGSVGDALKEAEETQEKHPSPAQAKRVAMFQATHKRLLLITLAALTERKG